MWLKRLYKRIEYAWTLKYCKKIDHASWEPAAIFDLDPFRRQGRLYNIRSWIFDRTLLAVLWVLREVWPNPQFGRLVIVTRASDVKQVLADAEHFTVPFGCEMKKLAGANSVLGMDGDPHTRLNQIIRDVLRPEDMDQILASTRKMTLNLIKTSGGHIDAVRDVITRVSTETCSQYFGLRIEDHDAFAEWSIAISMLLFADPFGSEKTRRTALAGALQMRRVVHRAIIRARKEGEQRTIIGRLVQLQAKQQLQDRESNADPKTALTDKDISGIMLSLVTGFVPTNTLAAGKILQELLRRPRRLSEARAMAVQGEREELKGVLLEAARFNAALSPGQWRYASKEQTIAPGTWRARKVKQGTVLLVATRSALRDRRAVERPSEFRRDRKHDPNVMFGFGPHRCLGEHIATEHMTEIFSILLAQANLRKVSGKYGQFAWVGPFAERLDMEFDNAALATTQSMLTICVPLKPDSRKDEVERMIGELEKGADLKLALKETRIVHFASLSVIEAGDIGRPDPYVLLELNVDGTPETAIPIVGHATQALLGPIFDHTQAGGAGLAESFETYALDLKTRPWGATGLNFNGTPEFAVVDIEAQHDLATFARDALRVFIECKSGIGNRALPAVKFIRHLIHQEKEECLKLAREAPGKKQAKVTADILRLLKRGDDFSDALILPGRKRLLISEWIERTGEDAIVHFLKSWDFWRPAIPLLVLAVMLIVGIYMTIELRGWLGWPYQLVISVVGGIVAAGSVAIAAAVAFLMVLRWHERTDVPDDRDPDLSGIQAIAERENLPGSAQNHFMAVTLMKPGLFRKLTLALSLWGIKQLVRHAYRPGFVLNMGTIHYAKWFRLPKTDKLIFLSNYDGSWESYLEDFIMKAHAGQTAAWSNGVGFPKTDLLIFEGAQDGDRFKRWVRRQQVPTQFWYSHFSELTTDEIRNNAVIHQGLARARTDTSAMTWLSCFGSMQRPDHAIEADEVQSLMFRGFKRSPCAAYALVTIPDDAKRRAAWLHALLPGKVLHDGSRAFDAEKGKESKDYVASRGSNVSTAAASDPGEFTKLTFGDQPFRQGRLENLATFVAFSAVGLKKLGLPSCGDDGVSGFSSVFDIGMVNRARILGDRHNSGDAWRWSDACRVDEAGKKIDDVRVADAILIVYAPILAPKPGEAQTDAGEEAGKIKPVTCEDVLERHRELLGDDFIEVIQSEAMPLGSGPSGFKEHFGFRDGISQPVIRGTHRLVEDPPERDLVEAGEFILGYRNNQGYYPPAISVSAETDLNDRLPEVIADSPPPFPSFRTALSGARDFGRNGSYLVVRQIEQHVSRFNAFAGAAAKNLNSESAENAGAPIDANWIAAKMMGRWKSGAPLALRPGDARGDRAGPSDATANDFTYAEDDPQGLRCPFGAHIRRANPRDGLRPGDTLQQAITNRHRLLRRGRTYGSEHGPDEKGLVFACLCADLERQFEFVQQTWIGSSSFHGLNGEVDPIIGSPDENAVFTIPTPSGPITLKDMQSFVTVRAGGYFFMPSYSALLYLWDLNGGDDQFPTSSDDNPV